MSPAISVVLAANASGIWAVQLLQWSSVQLLCVLTVFYNPPLWLYQTTGGWTSHCFLGKNLVFWIIPPQLVARIQFCDLNVLQNHFCVSGSLCFT